jgi:hypothetical protein
MAWGVGCHQGLVRLRTSPYGDQYQWRKPIAAAEFRKPCVQLLYDVQPPVGYAAAIQNPLEGMVLNARLRWDDAVRPLLHQFDLLCEDHNAARLTVQEFAVRRDGLLDAVRQLAHERDELDEDLAAYHSAEAASQRRPGPDEDPTSESSSARAAMKAAQEKADAVIARAARLVERLGAPKVELGQMAGPEPSAGPVRKPAPSEQP